MEDETKKDAPEASGQKVESVEDKDIRENKWWALLSYLGALALLPLLLKQDSQYAQFHAKQGLVILGGWVLAWLPFGFVLAIFSLVLSILGIISVIKEEKRKLPIVGELAEKINL